MRMVLWLTLGLMLTLSAAGCGGGEPDPPDDACGPSNCDGCCSGGRCTPGATVEACGAGGGECAACTGGQSCEAGACATEENGCSPANCTGCCDGDTCRAGSTADACGAAGSSCLACGSSQVCSAGACEEVSGPCSAATCPDGCCDGTACRAGTTIGACGVGGQACQTCSGNEVCNTGVCQLDQPGCTAQTCPDGCCDGAACRAGTTIGACGVGGQACQNCSGDEVCNTGVCQLEQLGCTAQTCADGCCQGDTCIAGTSNETCGVGGNACSACGSGTSCEGGSCIPLTSCTAATCPNGCCDGETCVAGTATERCGDGGAACADCGIGACVARACVAACPPGASMDATGACNCNDARYELNADQTACVPKAEWTLLVFMIADNDLEYFGVADVKEMVAAHPANAINVVVQMDRVLTYSSEALPVLGADATARRFEVRSNGLVPIGTGLGETNTGDPAILADFVGWGLNAYPAKREAIVMWNHGGAWTGFGGDETNNHDDLSLTELSNGIALGLSLAGRSKVELLGFDACLMSSLEVGGELANLARYIVASEELEPGVGWDYTAVLQSLNANPAQDAATLGMTMVDEYFHQFDGNPMRQSTATLALIETAAVPALITAVEALATRLDATVVARTPWLDVARAYTRAQRFLYNDKSLFVRDLGSFLYGLRGGTADAQVRSLVDATLTAYTSAVVYQLNGMARPGATGLSVYMPSTAGQYHQSIGGYSAASPFASGPWGNFLAAYLAQAAADIQPPIFQPVSGSPGQLGVTLSTAILADDLNDAFLWTFVKSGESLLLARRVPVAPDPLGVVLETYDYTVGVLSDGNGMAFAPVLYDYESWRIALADPVDTFDVYSAAILAEASTDGLQWKRGYLDVTINIDTGLHAVGPFYVAENGAIGELPLPTGAFVRPLWLVATQTGGTLVAGDQLVQPSGGMVLSTHKLPSHTELALAFAATDYVGNEATASMANTISVPGAPCALHTDCAADEFCGIGDTCSPVYGTTFQITSVSTDFAPQMSDGSAWDAFGGAPDPWVQVEVGGAILGSTPVQSNTFSASWFTAVNVTFQPGDTVILWAWDEDLSSSDYAIGMEWLDPVSLVRDGYAYYSDPQAQVTWLDFGIEEL